MKCKKCGADTAQDLISSLCPACLEAEKAGEGLYRKMLIFLGVFAALMILLTVFSTPHKPDSDQASSPDAQTAPTAQAPVPATTTPQTTDITPAEPSRQQWNYETVTMDAGSKTVKVGCLRSDEMVTLNSPYSDVYAQLCFRTNGDVFLGLLGQGQLLSGDYHGARIRVGSGPAKSFSLVAPADYSSNVAFISPHGPLIAAARAGKQIFIEATYYDAGAQTLSFSPSQPLDLTSK